MFHKNVPRCGKCSTLAKKICKKNEKKLVCGEKTVIVSLMENKNEIVTLPNGEKAYKLWYGTVQTVAELKAFRAEMIAKLATAEGWDIPFTRTALSATEFKLNQLGEKI